MATSNRDIVTKAKAVEEAVRRVLPDGTIREKITIRKTTHDGWTITEKILRTEQPPSGNLNKTDVKSENEEIYKDQNDENEDENTDDDDDDDDEDNQSTGKNEKVEDEEAKAVVEKPKKKSQLDELREELLHSHNKNRAKHDACALVLSNQLNSTAQEWAEYLARINVLQHRTNLHALKYGENIFMTYGMKGAVTPSQATQYWYNEINHFNFNYGEFSMNTGHFTQLVWKKTKEVGFGCATSNSGSIFVVANYFPAGNMQGCFRENVSPPTS